ncbi:MAG: FMN-binding negative transcriptional regulator [Sneathiella sp.]|nr:FMN-binding negative transcriptional regulator [Sneathiella sp.]
MYIPPHFKASEVDTLRKLLPMASFATLVSTDDDGLPYATHLPVSFDAAAGGECGVIYGHVSRANSHHHFFHKPALIIFSGPHAYVSPRDYASDINVPTWNYIAVHAYGSLTPIDDADRVKEVLATLTRENEGDNPWTMAEVDEKRIQGLLKGIVAFEMKIERLEAKAKLGQNKSAEDRRALHNALKETDIGSW